MRLPGTRYQEPGWEQVRKLLGQCSLSVLARLDVGDPQTALEDYVEAMATLLAAQSGTARATQAGNAYGETVLELAQSLLAELSARPADWGQCCQALLSDPNHSEAALRKKFNDMYAVLRDKVDADNYQVACGRLCSPNKMYTYRMLDTARAEVLALFDNWEAHHAQLEAIFARPLPVQPIEVRRREVKAEWLIRWSATREQFGLGAGPMHTRSKRFASLRNQPEAIAAMLDEIAEYEALSANRDSDWAQGAADHGAWLDDLWRVLDASERAEQAGLAPPDCLLVAPPPDLFDGAPEPAPDWVPEEALALQPAVAAAPLATAWQQRAQEAADLNAVLADLPCEVKLSVFLKFFGPRDDTYPDEWLDPATGALPSMQQLAQTAKLSLPTLRKRRDAAIAILQAAHRP